MMRFDPKLAAMMMVGVVLGVSSVASAQDKPDANALTDKVQAFYESINDFQARFTQTYTDVAADEKKTFEGKVFFKKVGKMRWDYLKGGALQKVLVSDGSAFTVYEAEYNQYFKKCLKDSQLPTALRFLMGTGDLKTDFTIKALPGTKDKTHRLELTPKKSSGQYKKLVFVVDAEKFSVSETIVYDPYGNTNRISFLTPAINKNLPDQGFDFKIPEGDNVRVVGGGRNLKCE